MRKSIRKFKLDNEVYNDFDKLMTMHLDEIDELTISYTENNVKFFNIISLFINVKSLIVCGSRAININRIILSICKPELLEQLTIDNTKLPTSVALKKLTNLKTVSLNNIDYCNLENFFNSIVNINKITSITLNNVAVQKGDTSIFNKYTKLESLELVNVEKGFIKNIDFLNNLKKIKNINFENNCINIDDASVLIDGDYKRKIDVTLPTLDSETKFSNYLEINDKNEIKLTTNAMDLSEYTKKVNFSNIDDLIIIINQNINLEEYFNSLKAVKQHISIAVKDLSCLDSYEAKIIKEKLDIKFINIIDFDDSTQFEGEKNCYSIDKYIKMREALNRVTIGINEYDSDIEKFLKVYKTLAETFTCDLNKNDVNKEYSLDTALLKKQCNSVIFSQILKSSLSCINIESVIVNGTFLKNKAINSWNQVKIDNNWYNTDIALDSIFAAKRKIKKALPYCLLSDKDFNKTHRKKSTKGIVCIYTVDRKAIKCFFRTGIFSRNIFKSYMVNFHNKIKKMFYFNKNQALPSGKTDE